LACNTINHENQKSTATLMCPKNEETLFIKRALDLGKRFWSLRRFIETGEDPEIVEQRELKEEISIIGKTAKTLGTWCHFNTIFGDILLLSLEVIIDNTLIMRPGDVAVGVDLFPPDKQPGRAFIHHDTTINIYKKYEKKQFF